MRRSLRSLVLGVVLVFASFLLPSHSPYGPADALSVDGRQKQVSEPEISPMGAIARGDVPKPDPDEIRARMMRADRVPRVPAPTGLQGSDRLVHSPTAPDFQSENTIAVNGSNVVVGYNDVRGFGLPDISVSGYAFSGDGGMTWTDGGQLPTIGGDQVFGDPDVKTWTDISGDRYFFYSSLYVTTGGLSSLCLHVSTDGGATWSLPREVTTASSAADFPDKEFLDVDPETGRIFISWTNFGIGTTMRVTYSDDKGLTWNGPFVFGNAGQGSIPRADGSSDNVYIVWRRSSDLQFVKSIDNGLTWSAPAAIPTALGLVNPMNPYGSDRIHGFASMALDHATGAIYVVYASRGLPPDFSEVYFVKSVNAGATWSAPVVLNALPGSDRSQFFPWVSVDPTSGRIDAVWYDQINGWLSSDVTDVFHTHSSDGGLTWSCATPLTDDRFHAEYGNTTSQPNIGDYIQCVSDGGLLYTAFAKTGEPSYLTFAPDTYVDITAVGTPDVPISLVGYNFVDSGCDPNGHVEKMETVDLFVTVKNYTNCLGSITGITGFLSTTTPGVTVLNGSSSYPNLGAAGTTSSNSVAFQFYVDGTFACGEDIDFVLRLVTASGDALVPFSLQTGVPNLNTLLTESFDGVVAPALPPGWTSSNLAGTLNPWGTSVIFAASGPNSVFCADIATTSLNRLVSPQIAVPANCDLLVVTFDITHDIEVDLERRAWDGALLRLEIDDGIGVQTELAGAIAASFEPFYPWQINRASSASQPLQDLSCWSSTTTPNFARVRLQFKDLAGSNVRLFFDMGTDVSVGTPTGMFVDNVLVESIEKRCSCTATAIGDPRIPRAFEIVSVTPNPFNPSTVVRFTLPEAMAVTAEVWSVDGRRVRTLARERSFGAGEGELRWDGVGEKGEPVASGVYFVRVSTALGQKTVRAVLLK